MRVAPELNKGVVMCGFAAMLSLDGRPADPAVIGRMTEVIAHRGPDDSGSYFSGPAGFGFRRLAILDLTPAGHQPMSTADGALTIVFNGEIYNYRELRQELQALGHAFRSTGDTEVLLHAYSEWGADCLPRLNGMWAFVIHDKRRGTLFGSRDRFGIKPLYHHRGRGHLLFASEIKAIRASGLYRGAPDWATAAAFLLEDRLDQTSDTFYQGIEQIPAATAFEADMQGRLRQWRYWAVESVPAVEVAEPAAAFAELFEDSMRLHLRSDVPVGVHLSGGLDSTSIICASARLRASANAGDPLMAFSYMPREYDESKYIADTITQTGAQIVPLETTPQQLWASLGRVLWFQDEPVHSMTPLIGFALMELTASSGIKVALNGQGADETIAGYGSFFRDYWQSLLVGGRVGETWREIGRYAAAHGGHRHRLFLRQLIRFAQTGLHGSGVWRELARWKHARQDEGRSVVYAAAHRVFARPAGGGVSFGPGFGSRALDQARPVADLPANRGPQLDGAFGRGARAVPRSPAGLFRPRTAGPLEAARSMEQVCTARSNARQDPRVGAIARGQDGIPEPGAAMV